MTLTVFVSVVLCLTSGVHGRWYPTAGTSFQIQLQGDVDVHVSASVYDIDLFDAHSSDISYLKSHNRKVVCYFSAGTWEDWREDAKHLAHSSVLGHTMQAPYTNERYWDIRSSTVRHVIARRLDYAHSRGCDGVDPDNVDTYDSNNGLGLTVSHQLDFNRWIASEAHSRGMAVGLKNVVALISSLESHYDFAINEGCHKHSGACDTYHRFLDHNKAVFNIEYVDNTSEAASKKRSVCSRPHGMTTVIKQYDLRSWMDHC